MVIWLQRSAEKRSFHIHIRRLSLTLTQLSLSWISLRNDSKTLLRRSLRFSNHHWSCFINEFGGIKIFTALPRPVLFFATFRGKLTRFLSGLLGFPWCFDWRNKSRIRSRKFVCLSERLRLENPRKWAQKKMKINKPKLIGLSNRKKLLSHRGRSFKWKSSSCSFKLTWFV